MGEGSGLEGGYAKLARSPVSRVHARLVVFPRESLRHARPGWLWCGLLPARGVSFPATIEHATKTRMSYINGLCAIIPPLFFYLSRFYTAVEKSNARVKRRIGVRSTSPVQRPATTRLTSLAAKVVRLPLPRGSFNAGLVELPTDGWARYACVYRPDEHSFHAMLLDETLQRHTAPVDLGLTNCADPRLIWHKGQLLMIYSSYDTGSFETECIRGAVIMENGNSFLRKVRPFRVSEPSGVRQKNWTPFEYEGELYLIGSTRPHAVYKLPEIGRVAHMFSETDWDTPWFNQDFKRGNAPPVRLDDGNYLNTFHTVQRHGAMHYYDNGCYVFEGKPPFRVIRSANRTYLPAEAAVEPHFRKAGQIAVCFPVGAVRHGERLLISYGDNDSAVKILETTVAEMLATTQEIS